MRTWRGRPGGASRCSTRRPALPRRPWRWPRPPRSVPPSPPPLAAWPAWAKTPPLRRARILDRFKRSCGSGPTSSPRRSRPSMARSMTMRRARSRAAWRSSSSRSARRSLLKGEFTENVGTGVDSHSLRQPLGVVAGHHAVQLPLHGADVDVPGGAGVRQLLHPEAVRARPVGLAADRRVARRGRAAGRRLQRRQRRQGGGRRAADPSGRQGGQLRRLDADRALHLPDRHRATGSACRRSAAPRTTW